MSAVNVRAATREDLPLILRLIHELAEFEGVPDGPQISVDDLARDGFDSSPPWFFALIATRADAGAGDEAVLGHALCSRAYSSWSGRALYLEDLFVRPQHRRAGVGRALLRHLAQIAVREGVHRIDWHVLESNSPARRFYAQLGARDLRVSEGRAALRLDYPAIQAAAAPAPEPEPEPHS